MDLQTYSNVLSKRGENPYEIPKNHKINLGQGLTRADIAFKKDLIREKVVWYNNQCRDCHAYIRNYHELYSICFAPKQHPFSRTQRLVVFIADIGLAACLSILAACVIRSIQDPSAGFDTDTTTITEIDSQISNTDLIIIHLCLSAFNGLLKSIMSGCMKYIAICPCCQTNSCGNTCRCFFECIGNCLICFWLFLVIIIFIVFVWIGYEYELLQAFIISFILTNIFAWLFSFCILTVCFKLKWNKEKRNEKNKLSKLKINYIDYERYEKGNEINAPLLVSIDGDDSVSKDSLPREMVDVSPVQTQVQYVVQQPTDISQQEEI